MNCRECRIKIEELMDGRTGPDDRELLGHVKTCGACEKEYRAAVALKKGFVFKQDIKIPDDFNAGVWKKIGGPKPSFMDRLKGIKIAPVRIMQSLAAAAALVFIVVMVQKTFVKYEIINKPAAEVINKGPQIAAKPKAGSFKATVKRPLVKHVPVEVAKAPDTSEPAKAQYVEPVIQAKIDEGPGRGPVKEVKPQTIYMANPVVQPPAKPAQENSSGVVSSAAISKTQVIAVKSSLPEPVVIELNVFNPDMGQAMHIKYEVKKSTMVTVIIFNLKGEPVANLVRTQKEPGVYEEKWSGRGDSGVAVPSGKYIIYIKTDQTEQKIKAAIIK
jgi:hypothetical protein